MKLKNKSSKENSERMLVFQNVSPRKDLRFKTLESFIASHTIKI